MRLIYLLTLLLTSCYAAPSVEEVPSGDTELATFAGGCFWCMQSPFEKLDGVLNTVVGYSGGQTVNPTYAQVSAGTTGHAECVQVSYDPSLVTYDQLLQVFWRNIDPTVENRQFCDVGSQYRSAIYYHTEAQRDAALSSKATLLESGKISQVFTEIESAGPFYLAEEYHQDYHVKNPTSYSYYRWRCGRDERLSELWGETSN